MGFDIFKKVDELAAQIEKIKHDGRIENQLKMLSAQYEKGNIYNNLIIGAGFVGFLTVWSNIKGDLSNADKVSSILWFTISLSIFILFEIWKMISSTLYAIRQAKIFEASSANINDKFEKYEIDSQIYAVTQQNLWLVALILTVIPGLLGVVILVKGFLTSLIKIPNWYSNLVSGTVIIGIIAIIVFLLLERYQLKKIYTSELMKAKAEIKGDFYELFKENKFINGQACLNEATRCLINGNLETAIMFQLNGIHNLRLSSNGVVVRNAEEYLIRDLLPLLKPEHFQTMEDNEVLFNQMNALFPDNNDIVHIELNKTLKRVAAAKEG